MAQLWLEPRLGAIAEMAGPVDISVTAADEPPNLKRSPFDICLFYTENLEKTQSRLFNEEIEPVCTPAIAKTLHEPLDLMHVRCIPDVVWTDWSIWAAAKMPGGVFTPDGPAFSLYSVAVRQALNGVGVLIGRKSLLREHLATGALVAPFNAPTPLGLTLATWMLPESRSNSVVKAVADALQAMALTPKTLEHQPSPKSRCS
ncbi:LysR substrate-binding domain-containing protein [Mesorhizobium wenxiniae]|uniref:LysR substrate-binding domain-containing protein n=1 Tax=Mesorhizobium wenxiniae TaxID=2014805 RepID=UPI001FD88213|nr:LysR substrate-binding domain-containing protein [Mesorhizobium wenxiniae]